MNNITLNVEKTVMQLQKYLEDHKYFEGYSDQAVVNRGVELLWNEPFLTAVVADVTERYPDIQVHMEKAEFELESDEQGACIYYQRLDLADIETQEVLKTYVKTLVDYNKTMICLRSHYANVPTWTGRSRTLKCIFDKLKVADGNPGYFQPLSLNVLVR